MAAPNIINATSIFGKTTAAQLDTTVTTSLLGIMLVLVISYLRLTPS